MVSNFRIMDNRIPSYQTSASKLVRKRYSFKQRSSHKKSRWKRLKWSTRWQVHFFIKHFLQFLLLMKRKIILMLEARAKNSTYSFCYVNLTIIYVLFFQTDLWNVSSASGVEYAWRCCGQKLLEKIIMLIK